MSASIPLDTVTFQCPTRIGPNTVTSASSSIAGGNPCRLDLDVEDRIIYVTRLRDHSETLVPLENVASMAPAKTATPAKTTVSTKR